MATYLTPEEKMVADDFAPKRKNYVEKAINPGLRVLADRKYDELDALLAGTANQLFDSRQGGHGQAGCDSGEGSQGAV